MVFKQQNMRMSLQNGGYDWLVRGFDWLTETSIGKQLTCFQPATRSGFHRLVTVSQAPNLGKRQP